MLALIRRLTLSTAVALLGTMAVAALAGADVAPPEVVGNTLTVASNDAGDSIGLAAAGGFVTVNGAATALPANGNAEIVVNAGGGADTVEASALAAANYKQLTVNGGEGDDLLTGGAGEDALRGDGGDDRLIGFKGKDDVTGGNGGDVMIWNNGDASDRNDGEAGVDETVVNGSPTGGDDMTAKPSPAEPGSVLFERLNLVKFEITLRAERLTVNGLGGADHFASDSQAAAGLDSLTSLAVNGGSEGDRLIGGDGDDRIAGDSGGDELGGGPGDDTIVWNDGDGSDPTNEGGTGFDQLQVNGAANAGDVMVLVSEGGASSLVRKNLGPFELDATPDVESVGVSGAGGGDSLSVIQIDFGPSVAVDGGSGDDELSGTEEADTVLGGSGDDVITGGGGADLLDGGEGEDRLFARDGSGDLVRGGGGEDAAQTDRRTVDVVDGVEAVDAAPDPVIPPIGESPPPKPTGESPPPQPPGDRAALLPRVGKVVLVRSHRRLIARVPVLCPAAESGGCRTALTLETARAVRLGTVRTVVVLGSARVDLASGQAKTVSVSINRAAASIARHGSFGARIRVASSDSAGNSAARSFAVGLRLPPR
jgi:Ca2+-binding RTX toxin-like protein